MIIFVESVRGKKETVYGLAGIGDLYVSADGGRNSCARVVPHHRHDVPGDRRGVPHQVTLLASRRRGRVVRRAGRRLP